MAPREIFEQELKQLKQAVAEMGERAELSYERLAFAVAEDDRGVMERLLDVDHEMTDMQRRIEARCLMLLTRQQPVARDLRAVSAALKVVTDIERAGDHVTDMAELFLRTPGILDQGPVPRQLLAMMQETGKMLHGAVESFVSGDLEQAQAVIRQDDVVDEAFNQIKNDTMEAIRSGNAEADLVVDLLMIAKYLEKIGDHAVNIGEWAIFRVTGDMGEHRLL